MQITGHGVRATRPGLTQDLRRLMHDRAGLARDRPRGHANGAEGLARPPQASKLTLDPLNVDLFVHLREPIEVARERPERLASGKWRQIGASEPRA